MRVIKYITLFVTLLNASVSNGAKILAIFPAPCKSHYILGENLLRGLAAKGHEVTMMSPFSLATPIKNYNHVAIEGTEDIKRRYWSKFMNVNTGHLERMILSVTMFPLLHHTVHNNTNIRKFVEQSEKYDLCIVSFVMMESVYAICNAVQAPAIGFSVIGLSSLITYHTQNPVPYSYVPNPFLSLTDNMTFMERVLNTLTWTSFDILNKFWIMPHHSRLVQHYYPNAPPLDEMLENVDLFLLNSHISTDTIKPLLPHIIPVGGFHLQIMEEIPKAIEEFLDMSKKGVIYFSLGTNAKSSDLDDHILKALLNTFAKLDYDILWKFDTELPKKPANVRTEKWLPQRSILRHPNVKIFMTHGGLGSVVESIYGAVPMICLPIFGDQGKNCAESVKNGYAVHLELASITEKKLLDSIREIETNPMYRESILLKSDLYKNQEINPMNRAIFWIEHVIKHKGAKHLKSTVTSIPWYQYYLLDVLGFLSVVLLMVFFQLVYIVKLYYKFMSWLVHKVVMPKAKAD